MGAGPSSSTLLAVMLQQKKTVVDYVGHDSDAALYMGSLDDGTVIPVRIILSIADYDAFGRQEQLTVTIRPGDELNDADSEFQAPTRE